MIRPKRRAYGSMTIAPAARLLRRMLSPLRRTRRPRTHVAQYESVLGTSFEFQCRTSRPGGGVHAEAAAAAEIRRLEKIFSSYDPGSEFSRWCSTYDEDVRVSPELADVLLLSSRLRVATHGAFDPALGRAHQRDRDAVVPTDLPDLWQLKRTEDETGTLARKRTRASLDLDAVAKGYIVDRAAAAAAAVDRVLDVLVNIGGDLRYIGAGEVEVGITDPFAPADNQQPMETVRLGAAGLATSGGYRRGSPSSGGWLSHLVDPRSGEPASGIASASVIAPDAATADALATAFGVLPPAESLAIAESMTEIACLLITADRGRVANRAWEHRRIG